MFACNKAGFSQIEAHIISDKVNLTLLVFETDKRVNLL